MALPRINTLSGDLLRDGIWILSRAKPDPAVNAFLPTLQGPQDTLSAAMGVRREADTVAIEASGATGYAFSLVRAAIGSLGIKAFGYFESRNHEGYLRIFPAAPSSLAETPLSKRGKVIDDLLERAKDPKTPSELAEQVKFLDNAVQMWKVALVNEDKADKQLAAALTEERAAADVWHTGVRMLKHQMGTVFPRDPAQVNSYFPKATTTKKGKAAGNGGTEPVTPA